MTNLALTPSVSTSRPSKALHIGLWVSQVVLALAFGLAGAVKTFTPIAELATQMAWVSAASPLLVRFIGGVELLAVAGLLLPSLLRILPALTGWAGAGLAVVMVLAAGVHVNYAEYPGVVMNLILGALAAFVAWGRLSRAPISPR